VKVKKSVLTDMKHLRGEENVTEALLGAVVAFHLSGKPNREIEALTSVSNSQVSTIIKQFNNKKTIGGGKSTGRPKKMTRRPLQALTDNVKDEPFKSIKGQQNAVNAIGYNFCWKTVKKYINEAGSFFRVFQPLARL
jgi:transposase